MRNGTANRRGFLRLLAAAPVAAKEASGKMGLEGVVGGNVVTHVGGPGGVPIGGRGGRKKWLQRAIADFWSPARTRERHHEADWHARRLDPDIASMRSVSPSAAYQIMRGRAIKRLDTNGLLALKESLEDEVSETLWGDN